MEVATYAKTFLFEILESVAATNFGQFIVKKIDAVLGIFVQPAKYCVDGESKGENRKLSWPVFWMVCLYLQTVRVVLSTIFVQFNGNAIEPKDVVTTLQIWQRNLRSIRFGGLRKMNGGKDTPNGNDGKLLSHRWFGCTNCFKLKNYRS